ncbi:hypothetical protein Tco_1143447 [Tanacetum coccineum]
MVGRGCGDDVDGVGRWLWWCRWCGCGGGDDGVGCVTAMVVEMILMLMAVAVWWWWRVVARGGEDRVDPEMRNVLCLGRKTRRKTFPAVAAWWPAAAGWFPAAGNHGEGEEL